MTKEKIKTIHEKNLIINNIIRAIMERHSFLICGHKNPDEDCISSMVACAILLSKFDKQPMVYIGGAVPENLQYLINICKYNSIRILRRKTVPPAMIDTVIFCDTAKRSMIDLSRKLQSLASGKKVIRIEFDHHIGADSEYLGDEGYRLVDEASSACELVGYLALKMNEKKGLLQNFMISDVFSRNLVLAILTGILGDTQKGQFLKSRRERKYYSIFAKLYNDILMRMTVKETNFNNMEEVFNELQQLSEAEERCYEYIMKRQRLSNSIGYVVLDGADMDHLHRHFDDETLVAVSKAVANELAEKAGKVGLICYFDRPGTSDLIQFRMRRSQAFRVFDLRQVLEIFKIKNGGGHEGAIGFRLPRNSIADINAYVGDMIARLEREF